jgi:hypothetical protein
VLIPGALAIPEALSLSVSPETAATGICPLLEFTILARQGPCATWELNPVSRDVFHSMLPKVVKKVPWTQS